MPMVRQRHGQTGGRTTYDSNTALPLRPLCSKKQKQEQKIEKSDDTDSSNNNIICMTPHGPRMQRRRVV